MPPPGPQPAPVGPCCPPSPAEIPPVVLATDAVATGHLPPDPGLPPCHHGHLHHDAGPGLPVPHGAWDRVGCRGGAMRVRAGLPPSIDRVGEPCRSGHSLGSPRPGTHAAAPPPQPLVCTPGACSAPPEVGEGRADGCRMLTGPRARLSANLASSSSLFACDLGK